MNMVTQHYGIPSALRFTTSVQPVDTDYIQSGDVA